MPANTFVLPRPILPQQAKPAFSEKIRKIVKELSYKLMRADSTEEKARAVVKSVLENLGGPEAPHFTFTNWIWR